LLRLPPKRFVREPLKSIRPNLLEGIGRVIIAHARLELALTELVYDLLRIDPKLGRQVLRGDNPTANFTIAQRLLKLWSIPVNDRKLRGDIESACRKRNEVAHGVWLRVQGTQQIQLVRDVRPTPVGPLDRRIMPQHAKRTVAHLKTDARFIHGVTDRVSALQKRVRGEVENWELVRPHRKPRAVAQA
jgi:hypothetical protein